MARKITKMQLDGMSRVPSGRLVKDGMASESLNMVSDLGECVPVLPPSLVEGDDIPDSWGTDNGEMVFVHVQPTNENHVYQVGQGIGTWAKEGDEWAFTAFLTMEKGETLNGIVNIGNTLVVSTSEATHYVLYKEGSYRDLGTELPKPAVMFIGTERERNTPFTEGTGLYNALKNEIWMAMPRLTSERDDSETADECATHGFYICGSDKYSVDSDDEEATKNARTQAIWNAYADAVAYVSKYNSMSGVNGRAFYQPYFFRYALRLYDGTYAMQSVPILLGAGVTWPQLLGDVHLSSGHGSGNGYYGFAMVMVYGVHAKLMERISDDWSDIVTAVDIFCSSPINPYDIGDAGISQVGDPIFVTEIDDGFDNTPSGNHSIDPGESNKYFEVQRYAPNESQQENRLLNYNVFYRIGSFLVDNSGFSFDEDYDPSQEFTANQDNLCEGIQLRKPDADTLVTHTSTASDSWDDYECDHTFRGNHSKTMNGRLAIWDIEKTLGTGSPVLTSPTGVTYTVQRISTRAYNEILPLHDMYKAYEYQFLYVLNIDGGTRSVYGRDWQRDRVFSTCLYLYAISDTASRRYYPLVQTGWISYPDAKCVRVLFKRRAVASYDYDTHEPSYDGDWSEVMTLPMKEHPFLNCAYAWLGFGEELVGETASDEDRDLFEGGVEDRRVAIDNQIMLSGVDNPFTFPASGRYTFDYAVVSCATANMPLSTGQFGQFPLYVFTKGGIWAMSMNADGTFASSSPFSRDVALSHRGVCEIDQGIIFIASKAVMAVQGGQITDISQLMTGRHDPLPSSAVEVLDSCGYGVESDDGGHTVLVPISALEGAWTDGSAFMDFMNDATAGYDYLGDRMIFINDDYDWQWVWMRKDATWHRTMLWEGDYITDSKDVEGAGAIKVRSFVNSWPGLLANLIGTAENHKPCALGEMTSQLDRTRDEGLSSTGLYVSRPLTFDNPDVFKSIMDLRIRGDLKRGNAKHLLLSSNNGHDWVLRRSLRGPSFRFHRIAVVTRMTTAERLSYLEIDLDERFANRLR